MARQTYIIGRAGDIKLYDDTVSRRHAALEIEDGRLSLRDLDSRNGTFELREKVLHPFNAGPIRDDQVFAFGECVRSVAQLLEAVAEAAGNAGREPPGSHTEPPLAPAEALADDAEPPRARLAAVDIIARLDQIDAACRDDGLGLEQACARYGISTATHARWREQYAGVRAARDDRLRMVERENEQLRKAIADLVLERDALKEALVRLRPPQRPELSNTPSIALVSDKKP